LHGAVPQGTIELVSVLTHELGHSFGLRDVGGMGAATVMSADYLQPFTKVVEPTERDGQAFVTVLKQSIQGTAAGVFNREFCAGLLDTRAGGARGK
jgi:hypothetical protein